MTGVVGLVLALVWIVAQPLADVIRNQASRTDPLTTLFVQIWLFGILPVAHSNPRSSQAAVALWFMMIVSIIGLRFLVTMPLRG